MEHKSFTVTELKALDNATDPPGTFEAIVSVFGNIDAGGDIVEKGAFTKSLAERGLPPIVWSHQWDDYTPIGATMQAEERDNGLYIKGRLFVGPEDDHPKAREVYTSMKNKDGNGASVLREFSFGYEAKDYSIEGEGDQRIRRLKEVALFEAGPTLVGMNPDTRLLGIKQMAATTAAEIKAGRVLSKANEARLRDAQSAINDVLTQLDAQPKDTGKSATPLVQPPAGEQETEPADNPPPNDPPAGSEEEAARIGAVLLARPDVLINQED